MKIKETYDENRVKRILIGTKTHKPIWVSRYDVIKAMNALGADGAEKEGHRSKNFHGVYAIYPAEDSNESELWRKEYSKQHFGVKKIFENIFHDNNFNTNQAANWLWHLDITVSEDPTIAIPRKKSRI
jgi:hypothetical protein